MPGWFESFGHFMGGAQPALDRYAQLRELRADQQIRRRQLEMEEERHREQQKLQALQMEQMQAALMGQKQSNLTNLYGPGVEITPELENEFKAAGMGGLVNTRPEMNLRQRTPQTPSAAGPGMGGAIDPTDLLGSTPGFTPQMRDAVTRFAGTRQQQDDEADRAFQRKVQEANLAQIGQQSQLTGMQIAEAKKKLEAMGRSEQGRAQIQQFLQQNPKASDSDLVRFAIGAGMSLGDDFAALLDMKAKLAQANATASAAGLRTGASTANAKLRFLQEQMAQGNMNARQIMQSIGQAFTSGDPESALRYLDSMDLESIFGPNAFGMGAGGGIYIPQSSFNLDLNPGGGATPMAPFGQPNPQLNEAINPPRQMVPSQNNPLRSATGHMSPLFTAIATKMDQMGAKDLNGLKQAIMREAPQNEVANPNSEVGALMQAIDSLMVNPILQNTFMTEYAKQKLNSSNR